MMRTKDDERTASALLLCERNHERELKAYEDALHIIKSARRSWVGLTEEETNDKAVFFHVSDISIEAFIGVIEHMLKEKNGGGSDTLDIKRIREASGVNQGMKMDSGLFT